MPRIIYPDTFLKQCELFVHVKQKHDADGAASVLNFFFAQQNINLDDDDLLRLAAIAHDANRQSLSLASEMHRAQRDLLFKPLMKRTRSYFQFLKNLYKPGIMEVGNWGAHITVKGRIKYPPRFLDRKAMFATLAAKHTTYPAGTSPLEPFLTLHQFSIAADTTTAAAALVQHDLFTKTSIDTETATANRNLKWNPVLKHLRSIGAFLIALYNNNPKKLGDWGFTVDHSPKKHRVITSKVLLKSHRTFTSVVVGGKLTNSGTVPLDLHKGRSISTSPRSIPPGTTIEIPKGFSIITISNPSLTTTGQFLTTRVK